jgi:RNA polymerase sigma-70 factor (ECF subfamily)
VLLYDMLLRLAPSPVTMLHRLIAVRQVRGARAALVELTELAGPLGRYHLFHATVAELLREVGDAEGAREADSRASRLTANPAEQAVLTRRLSWTSS